MSNEINTKVQQKKIALEKAQTKAEAMRHSIAGKQMALEQLEADIERKQADMDRMVELAKTHAPMQARYDELVAKIQSILDEHHWEPGMDSSLKIGNNAELKALKAEREELEPKIKETLPAIMAIYYGKA